MEDWITPNEASRRITLRAGFVITPDDLKQQRQWGKLKKVKRINAHLSFYDGEEINALNPSFKRVRVPADQWESVIQGIDEKRKKRQPKTEEKVPQPA